MRVFGFGKKNGCENHKESVTLNQNIEKKITEQKLDKSKSIPWTSELSVSNFFVSKKYHIQPIGLAMGNGTFSQFSYQGCRTRYDFDKASKSKMKDLKEAYKLCIERLRLHAQSMGANAIIDFRIMKHAPFFKHEHNEFIVVGTAVKIEGFTPSKLPLVCACTVLELMKLLEAGSLPIGIGIGIGVDYEIGRPMSFNWNTVKNNMESDCISYAVQRAREDVIYEVRSENATGFLQKSEYISKLEFEYEENDLDYVCILTKCLHIGTIIIEGADKHQHTIKMALDLNN